MPKRIQLSRQKGWRKPEGAIVCSRPGPWGNPYRIATDQEIREAGYFGFMLPQNSEQVVICFRLWLHQHPDGIKRLEEAKKTLRGHDLCCWCALNKPCHVDVWLELVNQ